MSVELAFRALPHFGELPLPAYATAGAAGMDIVAAVTEDLVLAPGARSAVPTGLSMAVPAGRGAGAPALRPCLAAWGHRPTRPAPSTVTTVAR